MRQCGNITEPAGHRWQYSRAHGHCMLDT